MALFVGTPTHRFPSSQHGIDGGGHGVASVSGGNCAHTFRGERLVGFSINSVHHVNIGGRKGSGLSE